MTPLIPPKINTAALDPDLFKSYWHLLKPRVMVLSIFTALIGMVAASHAGLSSLNGIALILIAMGAGGAAALNMSLEPHIDTMMKRTQERPIPAGLVSANEAFMLGMLLSISAVFLMALLIGYMPAFLLGLTILFYGYFYTLILKPNTPYNIVWGGISGALPPVIGWFCITEQVSWIPLYLFGLIFLWTLPHFWALAIQFKTDYQNANIPMLPSTHGIPHTKNQIYLYSWITAIFGALPYVLAPQGWILSAIALYLAVKLIHMSHQLKAEKISPMSLFKYSILYLFAMHLLLVVYLKIDFQGI
jgi:protoheme IX farnesyltransferase